MSRLPYISIRGSNVISNDPMIRISAALYLLTEAFLIDAEKVLSFITKPVDNGEDDTEICHNSNKNAGGWTDHHSLVIYERSVLMLVVYTVNYGFL
jgi:hypothetical protein